MASQTYTFGDKEYTKQQVIDYGRAHYPKFYWIKRGLGIGGIVSSALVFLIIFVMGALLEKEVGAENMDLYYGDPRMVIYIVAAIIDAIIGVALIISSFVKPDDEKCFIHGQKCLAKIAADIAYYKQNHRL